MNKILKNVLADNGYNLIALPKENIEPLTLLLDENGSVSSLESRLTDLFAISEAAPPQIIKDTAAADITGDASVSYEADSGISVLSWLLDKFQMGKLKTSFNLDGNKIVNIRYENVLEDKISLLQLDNFLSGSEPVEKKFSTYKERLENSELYVINSVLKSNSFTVTMEDKNGSSVNIETNIKDIINSSNNITSAKNNSFTLKNANQTPLVFAFKAQRVLYDKKEWWQFFKKESAGFRIKNETGLVLRDESDYPTIPLPPKYDSDVSFN